MKRNKNNYKIQDGCHNCKKVILTYFSDDSGVYFCPPPLQKKSKPIKDLDEAIDIINNDLKKIKRKKITQMDHSVDAAGICDLYEKQS